MIELDAALERHGVPSRAAALARVAAEAAVDGGRAALDHYGESDLEVRNKGRNDPVTAADQAANRAILEVLHRAAAGIPVLSEESPPPQDAGNALWVVDPLDGTKEFIAGNGEFSIMVGLAREGRAVLGATFEPATGRLLVGVADQVALLVDEPDAAAANPEPVRIVDRSPAKPWRFARSRSHPSERLTGLIDALGDIESVVSGSVGIKCALIALGAADLYVHPVPYLKEWDTCAPEAVLRGAGGRVTDCLGQPLAYGKADTRQPHGIFAARPPVWTEARGVVEQFWERE